VALSGNRYYITDNIYERLALKLYLRIWTTSTCWSSYSHWRWCR
jgi:hypothetical protein